MITTKDVLLIASSRSKLKYEQLTAEERVAYVRVSEELESLGGLLKSQMTDPAKFDLRTTAGFNVNSGVRSYIPKDLWFSLSPTATAQTLAGMPQLFMIVSERGTEYGFGASVSPSDFSQKSVKEIVRKAAPVIFDQLPLPGSSEAIQIQRNIEANGPWYFRRKHRLPPNQRDFPSLDAWLTYLQSTDGKRSAAGSISRYLLPDEVDGVNLQDEVRTLAHLFEPLADRAWHAPLVSVKTPDFENPELVSTDEFAQHLSEFLRCYGEKRSGPFGIDEELSAAMRELQGWLERSPSVASRPTIRVKIGVGQGGWTKTPWIALLDSRETDTTQRGRYIVFLVAEDLSTTYLTLNQGMTFLVNTHGQRAAVSEMQNVAEAARKLLPELSEWGFTVSSNIELKSTTSAAKKYEEGTIGFVEIASQNIPNDDQINDYLDSLLEGYERLIIFGEPESEAGAVMEKTSEEYGVDDALSELFIERHDIERYLDVWRNKKNLILQGAPGVGKSFVARKLAYTLIGYKDDSKVQTVQFHQSYSYEDFVQGYRPNGAQGFERKNGAFYEFRDRAIADPDGTYVFIIDEINRGNLSKIFGELMLLIEPDKRGPIWKARLAYAREEDEEFFIPGNLFVLGMMNTADRSLSLVDYALRRRFGFVAMEPMFGAPKFRTYLKSHGITDEVATRIILGMGELNQTIASDRKNLGPGFRIGHSFFTPTEFITSPEIWYRRIVETEIHPLLEEYWFDAPETADQWRDKLLG